MSKQGSAVTVRAREFVRIASHREIEEERRRRRRRAEVEITVQVHPEIASIKSRESSRGHLAAAQPANQKTPDIKLHKRTPRMC
ncbi:hypothetical protein SRHO_G00254690 [Serrasalmus rhombeus]